MINFNAFPFYTSIDDQWHRKAYCYNDTCTFKLFMPQDRLLPFQLQRLATTATVTAIDLWCLDQKSIIPQEDLLVNIDATEIQIDNIDDVDYITYFGRLAYLNSLEIDCGVYYITVEDTDGNKWYSEVFHVSDITDDTGDILRAVSYGSKVMPEVNRAVDGSDDRKIN